MNLTEILDRDNAKVQLAEATALEILARHAGPARQMLDGAKREFTQTPASDLGIFISPSAAEMFYKGRKEATKSLFDAYATTAFSQVRDAEAFIALLNPIAERVREKLSVLDPQESELCARAWIRRARERVVEQAAADGNVIERNSTSGAVVAPLAESPSIDSSVRKPEENPSPCQLEDAAPLDLEIVTKSGTCAEQEVAQTTSKESSASDSVAEERHSLLREFKKAGRRNNIKITDQMIAMAANPGKWNDRTMVTWWKRNDQSCKPRHDKMIRAVLSEDPASLWPKS